MTIAKFNQIRHGHPSFEATKEADIRARLAANQGQARVLVHPSYMGINPDPVLHNRLPATKAPSGIYSSYLRGLIEFVEADPRPTFALIDGSHETNQQEWVTENLRQAPIISVITQNGDPAPRMEVRQPYFAWENFRKTLTALGVKETIVFGELLLFNERGKFKGCVAAAYDVLRSGFSSPIRTQLLEEYSWPNCQMDY